MTKPVRFDNLVYASEFLRNQYNYSISSATIYLMENMFTLGTDNGVWINLPKENV